MWPLAGWRAPLWGLLLMEYLYGLESLRDRRKSLMVWPLTGWSASRCGGAAGAAFALGVWMTSQIRYYSL